MTVLQPSRTHYANEAAHLADLVSLRFGDEAYGASIPRRVEVAEAGMTTDNGRKARQAIMLSANDPTISSIMCGWIDGSKRVAELRSYAIVSQQYKQRFGLPLDIGKLEYDRFIRAMQDLLKNQAIDVRVSHQAPPRAATVSSVPPPPMTPVVRTIASPVTSTNPWLLAMTYVAGFLSCLALAAAGVL